MLIINKWIILIKQVIEHLPKDNKREQIAILPLYVKFTMPKVMKQMMFTKQKLHPRNQWQYDVNYLCIPVLMYNFSQSYIVYYIFESKIIWGVYCM